MRGSYTVDKFNTESVKIIIISQPLIHVPHYLCGSGSLWNAIKIFFETWLRSSTELLLKNVDEKIFNWVLLEKKSHLCGKSERT